MCMYTYVHTDVQPVSLVCDVTFVVSSHFKMSFTIRRGDDILLAFVVFTGTFVV